MCCTPGWMDSRERSGLHTVKLLDLAAVAIGTIDISLASDCFE